MSRSKAMSTARAQEKKPPQQGRQAHPGPADQPSHRCPRRRVAEVEADIKAPTTVEPEIVDDARLMRTVLGVGSLPWSACSSSQRCGTRDKRRPSRSRGPPALPPSTSAAVPSVANAKLPPAERAFATLSTWLLHCRCQELANSSQLYDARKNRT